jgi:nitroimidazol reductase NimA-like FMN-containing flavoprotein (pyridoxamine 5'-phosphate oxidase superfamily)
MNTTTTNDHPTTTDPNPVDDPRQIERTWRAIHRHHFAVLSTVSPAGHPHAAGVSYCAVDERLYVNTHRTSRKARNVAADGRVGVVIPVRRLPVGPPFNVQFQGTATLLAQDDPEITALLAHNELRGIVSHGELDEADGCFLRIEPTRRIHTYGIGVSVMAVARDPLHNGPRSITVAAAQRPTGP